jgi:1,4-dihydroxy-2-naphthoyl-CoA hydrolase
MPVGPTVHQPAGVLHGGASAALAETAASIGAWLNCDHDREFAVGIELNISHLRALTEGVLRATAVPARKGRSIHVWQIDLTDGEDRLVATARCTVAIRKKERT